MLISQFVFLIRWGYDRNGNNEKACKDYYTRKTKGCTGIINEEVEVVQWNNKEMKRWKWCSGTINAEVEAVHNKGGK